MRTAVFVALLLASTLTAGTIAAAGRISDGKIAPAKRVSIVDPSSKHPSQSRPAASKTEDRSAKRVSIVVPISEPPSRPRTSESSENGSVLRRFSAVGLSPGYTLRPHILLPEPELLMRQAAPDCEFKSTARGADEAALPVMRLDYERQCYRQSEFILRARMERLQDAVIRTIESVKGWDR